MKGFGFAQHQHVEPARDQRNRQQGQRNHRRDGRGLRPCRATERAEQPEGNVAQLPVVGDEHQKADAGIGDGRDGKTCQQEDGDRGAAVAAGDSIKQRGGEQRSHECGDRQQLQLQEAEARAPCAVGDHDGGGGRERAAAGDADQRRVGEGIAEQALHDGAGECEQTADHAGNRDAGNSDRP